MIDRGDAVNLARNIESSDGYAHAILPSGVKCLADAVLSMDEYIRQSEALERDAARWRHAVKYGFPVRNQSPHTEDLRWVAFRERALTSLGATPDAAIDAAMRSGVSEGSK